MLLEGSCHCASVRFSVNSPHPYPFNYCYCTICRKTAGALRLILVPKTIPEKWKAGASFPYIRWWLPVLKVASLSKAPVSETFVDFAAQRFGSGIHVGLSWFTPSHLRLTLNCLSPRNMLTWCWISKRHRLKFNQALRILTLLYTQKSPLPNGINALVYKSSSV